MKKLKELLEKVTEKVNELNGQTFNTSKLEQRGVADIIEFMVVDKIKTLHNVKKNMIVKGKASKKAIEDVELVCNPYTIKIDAKSHDVNSNFSMPNLISISKLANYYKKDTNYLIYVFIDYLTENDNTTLKNVTVTLVEELSWKILAIQNLGKGQLQVKNMNNALIFIKKDRKKWIGTLKENSYIYYDNLIRKIEKYKEAL